MMQLVWSAVGRCVKFGVLLGILIAFGIANLCYFFLNVVFDLDALPFLEYARYTYIGWNALILAIEAFSNILLRYILARCLAHRWGVRVACVIIGMVKYGLCAVEYRDWDASKFRGWMVERIDTDTLSIRRRIVHDW